MYSYKVCFTDGTSAVFRHCLNVDEVHDYLSDFNRESQIVDTIQEIEDEQTIQEQASNEKKEEEGRDREVEGMA